VGAWRYEHIPDWEAVGGSGGGGIESEVSEVDATALHTFEVLEDDGWDEGLELGDVSAECDDLAYEAAAGEGILIAGHYEDGFDATDGAVGECQLELVSEIGDVADAAEDDGGVDGSDEVHGEAFVFGSVSAGDIGQEMPDHVQAVVEGEEFAFFGVDADGDDDFVEEPDSAADDVEVAVGNGIELAWEDGDTGACGVSHVLPPRSESISLGREKFHGLWTESAV